MSVLEVLACFFGGCMLLGWCWVGFLMWTAPYGDEDANGFYLTDEDGTRL
jgi:hypothetical protein